jgi:hypothetical protein
MCPPRPAAGVFLFGFRQGTCQLRMDFIAALKNEVFRPLVTLVIPGAIAIGPFILVAAYYFPQVNAFWNEHPSAFVAILIVSILTVGLILENLGSFIEWNIFDEILDRKDPEHKANWERYLQLWLNDEIIGQRYLRQNLTRLKFELSMVPGLFFFFCGLLWANRLYHLWRNSRFIWLSLVIIVVTVLMLFEAYRSAKTLARTRSLIIEASVDRPGTSG